MGYITFYDDDDNELRIATTKEVCPTCRGEGKHVNRNIDGNGITADEWYNEWGDEEREMYMTGGYDVVCEECKGENVIDVPDEDDVNFPAYYKYMQEMWEMEAEMAAERRAGC